MLLFYFAHCHNSSIGSRWSHGRILIVDTPLGTAFRTYKLVVTFGCCCGLREKKFEDVFSDFAHEACFLGITPGAAFGALSFYFLCHNILFSTRQGLQVAALNVEEIVVGSHVVQFIPIGGQHRGAVEIPQQLPDMEQHG